MDVSQLEYGELDMAEKTDKTDEAANRARPVQVSSLAYTRVSRASELTGLSRAQIIDHLVTRHTIKDLVALLKADGVKRRHVGRAKRLYHT